MRSRCHEYQFSFILKIEVITRATISHLPRLALKKSLRELGNGIFFVAYTEEGGWVETSNVSPGEEVPLLELPRAASTSRG